ncbi:uncharacterized protein LOC123529542 [Mercenaria mercenaria]|uniref:uncharacterized protein LOC123529542 n=1 Tax=Mercenaria mercenaria TaxID=6596 RepID=UPI001E1DADB9|nr:uncharacterized protein LOC123529542 [Mercenaria mercenaria]
MHRCRELICYRRREDETQRNVCEQCNRLKGKICELEEEKRKLEDELKLCQLDLKRTLESYSKEIFELKDKERERRVVSAAFDGVEDMSDPFSNAKLAKKFDEIKDKEWYTLFKKLLDREDEIDAIKRISANAKEAYRLCKDNMQSTDYRKQREYFKKEENRHSETETIIESMLQGGKPSYFSDELRRFLLVYVDICLLLIIAQPEISLEFDVVGRKLTGTPKESFSAYCPQDVIERPEEVDTILGVVWPELNDHHGVHKMGLVVLVDKRIEDRPVGLFRKLGLLQRNVLIDIFERK